MTDVNEQFVKRRWKSARVLPSGCDVAPAGRNPRATYYAVFVGASTLKGGNGARRKTGWMGSESEAWLEAARRLKQGTQQSAEEGTKCQSN